MILSVWGKQIVSFESSLGNRLEHNLASLLHLSNLGLQVQVASFDLVWKHLLIGCVFPGSLFGVFPEYHRLFLTDVYEVQYIVDNGIGGQALQGNTLRHSALKLVQIHCAKSTNAKEFEVHVFPKENAKFGSTLSCLKNGLPAWMSPC
jgi:hypothetical protein